MRCFNVKLNLCTGSACAPDMKADGTQFQHQLNIEAQRQQIQQQYQAPQFNVNAIPSSATPDMLVPQQPQIQQQSIPSQVSQVPVAPTPASIAGFSTPGYPRAVMCPTCRRMGP